MTDDWRARALARVVPTREEDEAVRSASDSLCQAVQAVLEREGWAGEPRVEGSVAKGTYLHGRGDADVFVAFPLDVPRDELDQRVRVLAGVLDQAVVAYAEHPYAQGRWQGLPAEVVPCYALDSPKELRSAVDRTRFHTAYVLEHLDEDQRNEVRLFKAFLHAAGVYGAEESVAGFSGYLAELAVLGCGSFEEALAWATRGFPHPLRVGGPSNEPFEDALVVVDPVDPTRNAAAAVSETALVRLREAAAAFRASPHERFFDPAAPPTLSPGNARELCAARGTRVLVVGADASAEDLEDQVFAQLRRTARLVQDALEREQVPVIAASVHVVTAGDAPGWAWALVEADEAALARPKRHVGPPADAGEHAERFRERWSGDPLAASEVFERDGRLQVRCRRGGDTLAGLVRAILAEAHAGKVVDRALGEDALVVLEGGAALERVPPEALAALLDRRRPWERKA